MNKEKVVFMTRVFLCVVVIVTIIIRFEHREVHDSYLSKFANKKLHIVGIVDSEPDVRENDVRFVLNSDPHLLLVKSSSLDIDYGEEVEVYGLEKKPGVIVSKDGSEFDYGAYLSKDNIFYTLDASSIKIISRDKGNKILKSLFDFKHAFIKNLDEVLPSPHAFLAAGLVITGKGSLSKDLQLEFQKVGLIHIVVLSGFNVTIVGETIVRVLSFLPKVVSSIFGAFGIVLFSLMTGGGSTVMRAMIMSLIGLFARLTERENSALVSLSVAISIMLILNPVILFYDPSFQMSVAATLGLILLSKPYEICILRMCGHRKIPEWLLSLTASALSTQTYTLPLIVRFSGIVSIIALPVNIIVLPLIPATMLFVFLTSVACFIANILAMPFAFVSWVLLSYELLVVHIGSSLSFSALALPTVSWSAVVCIYLFLIAVTLVVRKRLLKIKIAS